MAEDSVDEPGADCCGGAGGPAKMAAMHDESGLPGAGAPRKWQIALEPPDAGCGAPAGLMEVDPYVRKVVSTSDIVDKDLMNSGDYTHMCGVQSAPRAESAERQS